MAFGKTFGWFGILLAATFARAEIVVESGPPKNRAAYISGFRLNAAEPGFEVRYAGEDTAWPAESARLEAVTLVTRDIPTKAGMSEVPLYLKVYAARDRAHLLGGSVNALAWNSPEGAPFSTPQTYRFENTVIPTASEVVFVFETDLAPRSPLGEAGLSLCETHRPSGYVTLVKELKDFQGAAPAIRLTLGAVVPAETAAGRPLVYGAVVAPVLAASLGGVVYLRRRRKRAASLPPPPGMED